jgi:enediyne biosynthesis protein E4
MVDLDNDGLPDLFGVTGGTYPGLEKQLPKIPWKTPRFLFRNLGMGKFEELIDEAGPGFSARHCSRWRSPAFIRSTTAGCILDWARLGKRT